MHVTAFLKDPAKHATGPIVVLFGPQGFLRQPALQALRTTVLGDDDEEAGLSRFSGKETDLRTVLDELATVSMWCDRRLVVVEGADDFVSKHRAALEKYLEKPAKKSVLVLDVKSWPKNTRLAKAVAKVGLDLECAELSGGELLKWLTETSRGEYGQRLSRDAAQLLVELVGNELGLLNQELAKLSSYVGERGGIEAEDVRALVGGWKAETTWAMIDALQDGDLSTALGCLDKLLVAGEAPQMILGGLIFVFRKLAHATELTRVGVPLPAALKQAGVFPRNVAPCERYLRRVGRPRAERLLPLLLEADGNLKGNSRAPERQHLEKLLVNLSGKLPIGTAS